jgi:hypothetical protein
MVFRFGSLDFEAFCVEEEERRGRKQNPRDRNFTPTGASWKKNRG